MTARKKFWLKVVLAVTFPLWALPAFAVLVAGVVCMIVWELVSSLVEPQTRRYGNGKRFP